MRLSLVEKLVICILFWGPSRSAINQNRLFAGWLVNLLGILIHGTFVMYNAALNASLSQSIIHSFGHFQWPTLYEIVESCSWLLYMDKLSIVLLKTLGTLYLLWLLRLSIFKSKSNLISHVKSSISAFRNKVPILCLRFMI